MSKNQNVTINTHQYPIRLLTDGWYSSITKGDDHCAKTYATTPDSAPKQGMHSLHLSPLFNATQAHIVSPSFKEKLMEFFNIHNSYYYSEDLPKEIQPLFDSKHDDLLKIIYEHGSEFTDWHQYYDVETQEFVPEVLAALRPIPLTTYAGQSQICLITAKDKQGESKIIGLPISPQKLFHAVAIAQDTGALLEFQMPQTSTQMGTLNVLRAGTMPASHKPKTQRI